MTIVSDELRRKRADAGSLGGLTKAYRNVADPARGTQMARDAFLKEFGRGEHSCALGCKPSPFPPDLSPEARERGAQLARRIHFQRMVGRREELRAEKKNGRPRRSPRAETARTSDARPSRGGPSRG